MYRKIQITEKEDLSGDFFDFADQQGWTDGLPVLPPTPDRVARMLATVNRDPGEEVAILPIRQGPATVKSLAVNAVMAGCRPEYFPVVVAAVEAMSDSQFPLRSMYGLKPVTPFLLVNGPIRDEIGINCNAACLGPGWRANATIGRAIRLIMINVGGGVPGVYTTTVFSSPLQYTFCAGESEEESQWEPFHVEHGYSKDQSVVTAFMTGSYIPLLAPLDWDQSVEGLLDQIGACMVSTGNTHMYAGYLCALLLLNPERAQFFAREGLSKADFKAALWEKTTLPRSAFRPETQRKLEELGRVKDDRVTLVNNPEEIHIAIMGGSGPHSVFLPGFSIEPCSITPVGRPIPKRKD